MAIHKHIPNLLYYLLLCLIFISATHNSQAQTIDHIEQRVTEFTLDNGLHFIIIQRDVAPVATFFTHVNVGSVNEPVGLTGLTHIFEHMAFKGTTSVGTKNWKEEKAVLIELDDAYREWLLLSRSPNPDPVQLDSLWTAFERLDEKASAFVISNEFDEIVQREGALGLNAFVSSDETGFISSLPENKAELWFALEADRFMNPVMREFYSEKNVIMEERRDGVENNPGGRLLEEVLSVAFSNFPYKHMAIGHAADIEAATIKDATDFFNTHYVPANMTISIAGDVDPDQMKYFAKTYFGPMPAGQLPPALVTKEPEQRGERRLTIHEESQPIMIITYHSVDANHPDALAGDILSGILTQGRTSRLHRRLVTEEEKALYIETINGFPGNRYAGLFLFYILPNDGVDVNEIEQIIYEEIDRIIEGDISQEEIDRIRINSRASTIYGLSSNNQLAISFARSHRQRGSWKAIFEDLEKMKAITVEDLQRVAESIFRKESRTVGYITNENPSISR